MQRRSACNRNHDRTNSVEEMVQNGTSSFTWSVDTSVRLKESIIQHLVLSTEETSLFLEIQITVTKAKHFRKRCSTRKMKNSYMLLGECHFDRISSLLVQYLTYCCISSGELMKHNEREVS